MNQPTTQCYENEIDNNKYTMKFSEKIFQAPSRSRTHDLPITGLDALTTELWVTHRVSRSQAWGYKSLDFASCEYTGH